jgi:hypothetical protein
VRGAFVAVRDLQGEPEVEQISQAAGAGLSIPCMRLEELALLRVSYLHSSDGSVTEPV